MFLKNIGSMLLYNTFIYQFTFLNYLNMRHPVRIINFFFIENQNQTKICLKHIAGRACVMILLVSTVS